ncbi:MAG TPA: hypothetical protein VGB15_12735, partial [Longimicrobium sp.]
MNSQGASEPGVAARMFFIWIELPQDYPSVLDQIGSPRLKNFVFAHVGYLLGSEEIALNACVIYFVSEVL